MTLPAGTTCDPSSGTLSSATSLYVLCQQQSGDSLPTGPQVTDLAVQPCEMCLRACVTLCMPTHRPQPCT